MNEAALIAAARKAAANAYAPYSGFCVGAAVVAADGTLYTAANVENASYGLSLCGETAAIVTAAAAGVRAITHVAVSAHWADCRGAPAIPVPCGRCRQVIAEFAREDAVVIVDRGEEIPPLRRTVGDLLPDAFNGSAIRAGGA